MPSDELDGCELPFDDEMSDDETDLYVLFAGADTAAKQKKRQAQWEELFKDA